MADTKFPTNVDSKTSLTSRTRSAYFFMLRLVESRRLRRYIAEFGNVFMLTKFILAYLGLPDNYEPSPTADPVRFLSRHIRQLPPHLLSKFSAITTPKQRTVIPIIRNRRLQYCDTHPAELDFASARNTWATLWEGQDHHLIRQVGEEEKEWTKQNFLAGAPKHVGKLGDLLGGYEEEREAERTRAIRRQRQNASDFVPEEDSDVEDELPQAETETPEQAKESFLRLVKERFIYGLLERTMIKWIGTKYWTPMMIEKLKKGGSMKKRNRKQDDNKPSPE